MLTISFLYTKNDLSVLDLLFSLSRLLYLSIISGISLSLIGVLLSSKLFLSVLFISYKIKSKLFFISSLCLTPIILMQVNAIFYATGIFVWNYVKCLENKDFIYFLLKIKNIDYFSYNLVYMIKIIQIPLHIKQYL